MSNSLKHQNQFLLYKTEQGDIKVDVLIQDETIWLTINQMADLLGIDKSGISRHIKNVFSTGELVKDSVVANFATTARDGKTYQVDYYNLDMIISVAYRVNSIRGTHFRIWATQQLKELIIKGFVINNEKLKNPNETTIKSKPIKNVVLSDASAANPHPHETELSTQTSQLTSLSNLSNKEASSTPAAKESLPKPKKPPNLPD